MQPVESLTMFSTTVANHTMGGECVLLHNPCWNPQWDVFNNVHYAMENVKYTGCHAIVHVVDPAELGLPAYANGAALLLFTYEGEMLTSVVEGNGFPFPGSDYSGSLLHFQGDKILPMEQHHLNPYFSSFPYTDIVNVLETILVPDVTATNYTQQLKEWVRSNYFNRFHDMLVTDTWNEKKDSISRPAFHMLMDPYINFQVETATTPLLEQIWELEKEHDGLALEASDLKHCHDTLKHILMLDNPSYVTKSSQTNRMLAWGKKDLWTMFRLQNLKGPRKRHKVMMPIWLKFLDNYPGRFTTNLHPTWPLSTHLGGQYMCDILLTLWECHLFLFQGC